MLWWHLRWHQNCRRYISTLECWQNVHICNNIGNGVTMYVISVELTFTRCRVLNVCANFFDEDWKKLKAKLRCQTCGISLFFRSFHNVLQTVCQWMGAKVHKRAKDAETRGSKSAKLWKMYRLVAWFGHSSLLFETSSNAVVQAKLRASYPVKREHRNHRVV